MKVSRWIKTPLIFGISLAILYTLFGIADTLQNFAGLFLVGAAFGFIIEFWSQISARRKNGSDKDGIYNERQERTFTVLLNYEKSFELSREAVNSLRPAKIKIDDIEKGIIEARTRMSWETFGNIIRLDLKKVGENLTEIEISTRPIPRTALVDYGEGWRCSEKIFVYLKEKDMEFNKKVLADSAELLENVYVKPFHRERI